VVEAALPSGSLITARTALEQGREVFALPWSLLHEGGKGCLHLIRDGAKMVQAIDDILEELAPLHRLQQELLTPQRTIDDTPPELAGLLKLVGFEAISLDELILSSGLPAARVLADLSALELAGEVTRCAGGYIRC